MLKSFAASPSSRICSLTVSILRPKRSQRRQKSDHFASSAGDRVSLWTLRV